MMAGARQTSEYDKEFLKRLLREMLIVRRFEEKAAQSYGLRKIGGFCHLYIGQEAVGSGAIAVLDLKKDYILTAYRDHGQAISAGISPKVIMAELYGKVTGCSKGKGGSMHLFDIEKHFYGGNGIVGAHIPPATGVALAAKYLKEGAVVLCFFGDGAVHQGSFHEALNMAGVWKLPIVYICENNQYGMGTDYRRVSAEPDLWKLSASYEMPGWYVDGMDVLAVYEQVKEAVQAAREKSQPSLIEARTYRYMGHSMSDPATYRTKEELQKHREQDPVLILKKKMNDAGILSEEEYSQMDQHARTTAAEAAEFAENSEQPAPETLYEDLWL